MPLDGGRYNDDDDFDELMLDEELLLEGSPREFLVDGLLGANELTIAWGPPKLGGKTAFWLRVARRVSQGLPVFGRAVRHEKQPQRTLFIALENGAAIRDRCEALLQVDGAAPNFRVITQPINLLDERFVCWLANFVSNENIVLVVIDTLARAMRGLDENRGADITPLFANLDRIRRADSWWGQTHIVGIHHGAKNGAGGPRGHGDFGAAPDTLIVHDELKDGTRVARVVAARADPPGLALRYRIRPVTLQDPRRTTVIAEEDDQARERGRARGAYAGLAFDQLQAAAAMGGPVPRKAWRANFYAAMPELSAENRRKQFARARAELLASGQVTELPDGAAMPAASGTGQ